MIPPFYDAVDRAVSYLSPEGYMGVTDFYVSSKYDLPLRQMKWGRRFFWRSIFDTDNIDLGPERRMYLDHRLERVYEYNSEVRGGKEWAARHIGCEQPCPATAVFAPFPPPPPGGGCLTGPTKHTARSRKLGPSSSSSPPGLDPLRPGPPRPLLRLDRPDPHPGEGRHLPRAQGGGAPHVPPNLPLLPVLGGPRARCPGKPREGGVCAVGRRPRDWMGGDVWEAGRATTIAL